jgi:peptide/nickel transport system permease protein
MAEASNPLVVATPLSPGAPAKTDRAIRTRPPLVQAAYRTLHNPMGVFGLSILVLLVLMALAAPIISPFDPTEQNAGAQLATPGGRFLLGADHLGRDLLSRIIYGARASLVVGVLAVSFGAFVGITTGLAAGFFRGVVDAVVMRFYDALLAFPAILLGIAVVSVIGSGTTSVAVALGIATMPGFARLMRSRVLIERERDYVLSARCIGARDSRIMWVHVLPNAVAPLIIQVSLAMGFAVLAESALSFLGLGTQPPQPSWGAMLNESRAYLRQAIWFGIFPGAALALLLLGLNFLADALRDALDPRRTNAGA